MSDNNQEVKKLEQNGYMQGPHVSVAKTNTGGTLAPLLGNSKKR